MLILGHFRHNKHHIVEFLMEDQTSAKSTLSAHCWHVVVFYIG